MKSELLAATSAVALLALAQPAHALQLVATIYGEYESDNGIGDLPNPLPDGSNPSSYNWVGNATNVYDTPNLFFVNPTGYTINNAQMVLSVTTADNNGQTTFNNGVTQTVSLGSLTPNSITQIVWGTSPAFNGGYGVSPNLFVSDYDDEYSNNYGAGISGNSGDANTDCTLTYNGGPHPEWQNFCAPIGNFDVTFTGTLSGAGPLDGQSVFSVFNELNTDGQYSGWEGIDPNGWSENATWDVHTGTVGGVLANIYLGTPGIVSSPEPATLSLMGAGLGALGIARRRRKKS